MSAGGLLRDWAAVGRQLFAAEAANMGLTGSNFDPADIAFSTAIPFTGNKFMPQQTVSAVIAFTVAASPVKGAQAYVRLVADGTNAPTFTGFKEWGGSLGYDNRAGIVNELSFFYDGYDYWYSFSQAVGAVAIDAAAPTASSAVVENAASSVVVITMSETMDTGFVPAAGAFTVGGHTVSSVGISGSTISLTLATPFVNGEAARTVAYTQPGTNNARDASGNLLANFSGLSITNNVGVVDTTPPAFASAAVANATPTVINITMSEALAAITPATSAFTVSGGKTVTGVAVSGTSVNVTVNTAYANGDTITVAYTQPGSNKLQDAAGNFTATFGAQSVTNNIASGEAQVRFNNVTSATESGTGPYTYTGGSGTQFSSSGALSITKLQSGVDGGLKLTLQDKATGSFPEFILGVTTSGTLANYQSLPYGIYVSSSNGNYQVITAGGVGGASVTIASANGDWMRLQRIGTTMTAEISKNSGSTWTVIHTWTGVSTAVHAFELLFKDTFVVTNGLGTGLA